MKILIVNDSAVMREIVARTLRQTSPVEHEIIEASNGQELLDTVARTEIDLIFCAWNMPEMTGIEALERLRANGSQVPFCFVTPDATKAMRKLARDADAFDFLTRPFTPEKFEQAVDESRR